MWVLPSAVPNAGTINRCFVDSYTVWGSGMTSAAAGSGTALTSVERANANCEGRRSILHNASREQWVAQTPMSFRTRARMSAAQ